MSIFHHEQTPSEIVDQTIVRRRSIRAFIDTPLPAGEMERILSVAARAPSGGNMQPWRVHILEDTARERFVKVVCDAYDGFNEGAPENIRKEYDYYPTEFFEPYAARRRKVGWDLYGLLGIERGEKEKMRVQQRRNFEFFGAPTGLIFTIDRKFTQGGWLDYGMFIQNIMIAAQARGIDSCPQAAWMEYPGAVAKALNLPHHEMVVCGMALGYADTAAVENTLVSERVPVSEFVVRHD
ncbi:MAG TPA: nitroreductase [Rhodocyclaceae bacterium]|nr:nitroreductase [Rhodocyclaceae bacterium]